MSFWNRGKKPFFSNTCIYSTCISLNEEGKIFGNYHARGANNIYCYLRDLATPPPPRYLTKLIETLPPRVIMRGEHYCAC